MKRKPSAGGKVAFPTASIALQLIDPRWPSAKERLNRPGTFEAKGVDAHGSRKSFYAKSAYEASQLAAESLGLLQSQDKTLHGYYVGSYWPSKRLDSDNWKDQIRWAYDGYIGDRWGGV